LRRGQRDAVERGLNEPAEENADRADDDQGQFQQHQRIPFPAAAASREDQDPADHLIHVCFFKTFSFFRWLLGFAVSLMLPPS
jgi:hypothetical protein